MKVLVTGGAGYIGSHTILGLLEEGHEVIVVDSLVNASLESLSRVKKISGRQLNFRQLDLTDASALDTVFVDNSIDAVVHFAGLKAVGESVGDPLKYYFNNVVGTLNLLRAMSDYGVRTLVFSSSATVYASSAEVPLVETSVLGAGNPYGRTKEHIEHVLTDLGKADTDWRIAILRYFNPVGAHESGLIGEDPQGVPNNLLPFVAQVAVGRRERVRIFGSDYPTKDGTGVRDYIHVMDLAAGHLSALEYLQREVGVYKWNLGTGMGSSVLEVIETFSRAAGCEIPYEFSPRRPGDAAVSYADPSAAATDLGWVAKRDLAQMCEDHWRWQSTNPQGFQSS